MTVRYDPHYYPYPSRRNMTYASRGMVCASQPQAAQAGLEILKKGGNAVDAIVATAAALTVVEPTANGIGSDAFALLWKDGTLRGLNASGPSPKALSMDLAHSKGWTGKLPMLGWAPATVPGAPAAWAELTRAHGRLSLAENLAPAVSLARDGHAVSVTTAHHWELARRKYSALQGEEFRAWFDAFTISGRAPRAGELRTSEAHARTLERIAETNARAFYEGDIAEKIVAAARTTGGYFTPDDLGAFAPEWVDPIGVNYKGYDVWEIPPNGQGIVALIALSILRGFDFSSHDDPETIHRQIEAIKMGFADAHRYVADRRFHDVPVAGLLADAYADRRRAQIGERAEDRKAGDPMHGGTVYLCAADGDGTMISYIQSNYMGFGSGVVVPETGVALNNRGYCFSLEPGHPNVLEPGKRPYNTIIPSFLTKDGLPVGPFGVMGGFMQPQGHLQVITNTLDFGMNPQEALDCPRWQWVGGKSFQVERGFDPYLVEQLRKRGHDIIIKDDLQGFGRGEMIWRNEEGVLMGATEPRADGTVAAW